MSNESMWHYTDQLGAQRGPVPEDELKNLIQRGVIPNTAIVWKEGMTQWLMHNQIPELQTAPATPRAAASPTTKETTQDLNPYSTPQSAANTSHTTFDTSQITRCGGIGRLVYFLISIAAAVISQIALFALAYTLAEPSLLGIGTIIIIVVSVIGSFVLVAYRYKNIGFSPWWCLLIIIPIVNLFIGIRCLILQEGWAHTRKLDTAGKVISWIIGILFLLYIALIVVAFVFAR